MEAWKKKKAEAAAAASPKPSTPLQQSATPIDTSPHADHIIASKSHLSGSVHICYLSNDKLY